MENQILNKKIIGHPYFLGALKELQLCIDSCGKTADPRCVAILGDSGCGKSTAIDKFVKEYHKEHSDKYKQPIIVVEAPTTVTVKSLASEVLFSIGDPFYHKGTEVQMTHRIIGQLKNLGTRLLIFDEMQNLIDRESDTLNYTASDWLKGLINKSGIPTVVVGLERTEELITVNPQLRRRFRAPFRMARFDWNKVASKRNFRGFLKALMSELKIDPAMQLDSDELVFRFYCASGGIVGYVMAIMREAEYLMINSKAEFIDTSILASAYESAICIDKNSSDEGLNPFLAQEKCLIEKALQAVKPFYTFPRKPRKS